MASGSNMHLSTKGMSDGYFSMVTYDKRLLNGTFFGNKRDHYVHYFGLLAYPALSTLSELEAT